MEREMSSFFGTGHLGEYLLRIVFTLWLIVMIIVQRASIAKLSFYSITVDRLLTNDTIQFARLLLFSSIVSIYCKSGCNKNAVLVCQF